MLRVSQGTCNRGALDGVSFKRHSLSGLSPNGFKLSGERSGAERSDSAEAPC
jgi:hypothetical protein